MSGVFARIKNSKDRNIIKLLSSGDLYDLPKDFEKNSYDYSIEIVLEDDFFFKIEKFRDSYGNELIKDNVNSIDYPQGNIEQIEDIVYICSVGQRYICYQKVNKSSIMKNRTISIGDQVKVEQESKRLIVNEIPDAIYDKKNDVLYFKKISTIKNFFDGIDELINEATDGDINQFLNCDMFCANSIKSENVGKQNRYRIKNALSSLNTMNKKQKKEFIKYVGDYCEDIKVKNNKCVIENDKDLRTLLNAINQKYYCAPITKEKRLANSFINL